jgi:arylsulfatase A-like enzyme
MLSTRGFRFRFACRSLLVGTLVVVAACQPDRTADDAPAGSAAMEPAAPDRASPGHRKVLVIGIDGIRPDVLAEVDTPALDALIAEGAFTDAARTGLPSVSGPGWSSFLIGVHPEKHGVVDNSFEGEHYAAYPDFLTRIEQVRPELATFAVVDWAPLGRSETGLPTLSDAIDERVVLDGYALGWLEADDASVDQATRALREGDPDALFVYLGNPDESSHTSGAIGREYRDAIAAADGHVARLIEAVRSRATYASEDWLVLVSTDHGRTADGDHGGDTPEERTIFFLASGPSARIGRLEGDVFIVDVAVTALAHLGIDIEPAWDLDGRVVGIR